MDDLLLDPKAALLKALRVSRGIKQIDLSSLTNIPQATLSKAETGAVELDDARWAVIADVLGVPFEAFANAPAHSPVRVFHRKQKSTATSDVNRIEADLTLTRHRAESLLESRETTLQRHDMMGGLYTPAEIALDVRKDLGLGAGPIGNLTKVIERAGAIIIRWPLASVQADAIAGWPQGGLPVILLGEHAPAERQRFTMAHEIGHAVLHDNEPTVQKEAEADEFAAEFLMPTEAVRKVWPVGAELEHLLQIKQEWGISLSALIRRGFDSNRLSERDYRAWMIRLTTTGMHRSEPAGLEPEEPLALHDAITTALESGDTLDDLAAKAGMLTHEFQTIFYPKEKA